MKKQKHLIIALSLVIGVVVGLIVGFILTDPCRDVQDVAGTIGRVEHYRDVQIAEEDIALRNQFLDDADMLESYEMYLGFEYTTNLRQAENTRFALLAARQHGDFGVQNHRTLDRMKEYTRLLDNARLRILEALGVINDLENREGVAIRSVLNRAGNAIVQTQIRSNVLFDYLTAVEDFFHTHPQAEYPALTRAHDELYATLLMHNIIRDNKPVLDHLLAKNLMNEDGELAQLDNETVLNYIIMDAARLQVQYLDQETLESLYDQETLNAISLFDQNVLGMYLQDQETLQDMGLFDQQTLNLLVLLDQENLSAYELFDQGVLGDHTLFDQETLQSFTIMDQEMLSFLDQETLQSIANQEVLRGSVLYDQERLNFVIMNQEQLQQMIRSGEQLQLFDSEQLGFRDAEQLQYFIMDGAALDFHFDFRVQ